MLFSTALSGKKMLSDLNSLSNNESFFSNTSDIEIIHRDVRRELKEVSCLKNFSYMFFFGIRR